VTYITLKKWAKTASFAKFDEMGQKELDRSVWGVYIGCAGGRYSAEPFSGGEQKSQLSVPPVSRSPEKSLSVFLVCRILVPIRAVR
jgi:hypothetical protein